MARVMHRSSSDGGSSSGWSEAAAAAAVGEEERAGWEVRPSGMVVQARDRGADGAAAGVPPRPPPPEIRVRVKYGASTHEVTVSSIATFGELKKALAPRTGLQPSEQQLTYKGRERKNSEFLDRFGVKNKSKLVVSEDPASLERRYIERQRNARIQNANRAIGAIALEVDKLADQVTSIEKSVSGGSKVAEVQITTLIELLMRHAVKLESIPADADTSSQKNLQVPYIHCTRASVTTTISSRGIVPLVPVQLSPSMRVGLSASAIHIIASACNASSAMTSGAMQASTRNATCGRVPYMPPRSRHRLIGSFLENTFVVQYQHREKLHLHNFPRLRMFGRSSPWMPA